MRVSPVIHTIKPSVSSLKSQTVRSDVGQLWRLPTVVAETGISKTEIYRKMKAGTFPTPIKLGIRAVAWSSYAVQDWVKSVINGGAQ